MAANIATDPAAILARLDARYDYSSWHWQPDTPPDLICIGAILVQHTQWSNVELALERLRDANALSLDAIHTLPEERLAELVRPAGTPMVKAKRLRSLAQLALDHGGLDALLALPTSELRPLLLATPGIGPESADAILLYAAGRPVFEIDAYTIRIFRRLGLGPERNDYHIWQHWFERAVIPGREGRGPRQQPWESAPRGRRGGRGTSPPLRSSSDGSTSTYRRYHALIVLHGKHTCRPRPRCASCCLLDFCPTGQQLIKEGGT